MNNEVDLLNFHWRYFLTLDADVETTLRYVELDRRNFETYSIEYVRLFFGICSEFESVCKNLCQSVESGKDFSKKNMPMLADTIGKHFPRIGALEISIPKLGENANIRPLEGWSKVNKNDSLVLSWWQDYNKVKHERQNNFVKANLGNVIYSLAGLFGVLLYWARNESKNGELEFGESPRVVYYDFGLGRIPKFGTRVCVLPDFPLETSENDSFS